MFRKPFLFLLPVALLAGCQTKPIAEMSYTEVKQLAGEITQRCYAQGVKPKSAEFEVCMRQEISREDATRASNQRRRMAAAAALGNAGRQMQANAAANRPVNCVSTGGYNTVNTTCY